MALQGMDGAGKDLVSGKGGMNTTGEVCAEEIKTRSGRIIKKLKLLENFVCD